MTLSVYGVQVSNYAKISEAEARVLPWVAIHGDDKFRYSYDLNEHSVVYDIGGYRGEWAGPIFEKFHCYIEIFEPVNQFVTLLTRQFSGNSKVVVHPFGLAGRKSTAKINVDAEASSLFKNDSGSELIHLEKASKWIRHDRVDLLKMNIEGGEYAVLEDLIEKGLIARFENLQLQFHTFAPNALARRKKLQKLLSKTHEMTFNYYFVWENWRLKK
jgi:FkbM family methyltransferase